MNLRKLSQEEHGRTRDLYEEIFPEDSQKFVDYYYTEKTKDNQIYVIEEDGKIQAMFQLNPYRIMVNGQESDAHYIVAVATHKEYRKRGYMAEMMRQALCDMYQAGEIFTYLMPAAESIYLPHDFRTVYEQEIPWYYPKETELSTEEIHPLTEDTCEELAQWASGHLARYYQIYTVRDAAYYRRLIKEFASDDGEIMVCRDEGRIVDCRYYYPPENLESGKAEDGKEKSKIMVRIVDVRRMLMSLKLKTLMAACFTVTDQLIKENNRCMTITGTEYSGVMLMDGLPENSEGKIPIGALASLLFGAKTVEEVAEEEGVEMTERLKGELKKIVPLSKIYLNEMV